MNRKKLITYDDKTGEILHEKEVKSWDGMDLVGYNEVTVSEANEVIENIQRKQARVTETVNQLYEAVRRSTQLNKEEKKELIQFLELL